MSADLSMGLWPRDLQPRTDAVMTFIAGHVAVQDQLDARPDRCLAEWIALVGGDVGRAAMLVARDPEHPKMRRAVVGWLACASADAVRALRAFTSGPAPAEPTEQLGEMHAHVVSELMSWPAWRPAIQIAGVIEAVGELALAARPLIRADPAAHGPVPRFNQAVTEAILASNPEPLPIAAMAEDEEPVDPVQATTWALEDARNSAAAAAALLHTGGVVRIPAGLDDLP